MAKAISWVAVNKSGEVCLDSDPSPLPRGWERCLDLQSGVMYLKQMNPPSQSESNIVKGKANNGAQPNAYKRRRLLFEADDGEGNPALQLTLSLPTCSSLDSGDSLHNSLRSRAQCFPLSKFAPSQADHSSVISHDNKCAPASCANDSVATSKTSCGGSESSSLIMNGMIALSQATPITKELESIRDVTTSSNGSSPSCNASSSSSSSSPKHKQWGIEGNGLRAKPMGVGGLNQERNLIKATGCPHCFMYVLPSRSDPKCPRCKSPILVDLSPLTTH